MIDLFLVGGAWISLVLAGLAYIQYRSEKQQIQEHISAHISGDLYNKQQAERSSWKRKLLEWADRLAPIGEKIELLSDPITIEDTLTKAGFPWRLNVRRMQGIKIVGVLIGFMFGFFYFFLGLPLAPMLLVFSPVIGYMSPIFAIRIKAKKRQEEIRYELPDFLDMMSITLQAGMGLDDALAYYVDTNKGPLSEELARLNQEIRFGVQREIAYRSLLKRTDSPELEALIQSVIQAHNLGTPIAETFAQQAEEMRRMRSEQAKEAAGKAAPKISMVGGLVIAPSIMILILGAIVYSYFIRPDSPFRSVFGG